MFNALAQLPKPALLGLISVGILLWLTAMEWAGGKFRDGRKTREDWQMFALSSLGITLVERPALQAAVFGVAAFVWPHPPTGLAAIQTQYLPLMVIAYLAVDELVHGYAHFWTHRRPPKHVFLAKVHAFYRSAHRAHHLLGGPDGKGEVSATHAVVAGWGWYFFLPHYWLGVLMLYVGLADTWFWAMLLKNLWGAHVHSNVRYDLWLLNHPNRWVRNTMWALCHVLTFPNQHHQHHARGANSAKNMQNVLSLYDWLLWDALVIERERPAVYGWKQRRAEQGALRRYLQRPLA